MVTGQSVSYNSDAEPDVALFYYLCWSLVLTTFSPLKRLGYGAIHAIARTFTQVVHMQAALSYTVVYLIINVRLSAVRQMILQDKFHELQAFSTYLCLLTIRPVLLSSYNVIPCCRQPTD